VENQALEAGVMTRDALKADYDRLCRQLDKAGIEPVVSSSVLEIFTDEELALLIRDCAMRLLQLRRLQA
jgi:hypothetical protein